MVKEEILKKVIDTLVGNGASFADVFIERKKTLLINMENKKLEKITTGTQIGGGLRVRYGDKTFFGYTEDLSEKALLALAKNLSSKEKGNCEATSYNYALKAAPTTYIEEGVKGDNILKEKIDLVLALNDVAWKRSSALVQVMVAYGEAEQEIYVMNSKGIYVKEFRPRTRVVSEGLAEKNGLLQRGYDAMGGLGTFSWLKNEDVTGLVTGAMDKAANLLLASEAPSGTMDVVLSGEAGGTMVHEACGHGLEGDIVKKGMSVYGGKIGEKVASSLITVVDDGTMKGKYGTSYYDDEGTKTNQNILIEKGILKGYMCDLKSAEDLGLKATGNGRREGYSVPPITRMTNTYIAPGDMDKDTILASVDQGLFVKKMGGGQVNTTTGDFVFEVSEGYLIDKGIIKEQVRGATLIGNGPNVLNKIDMVGSDFGYSLGTCGKDGQRVPVADAQPTLRIPALTVGGTK
ncbi:hypothetical protein AZF37_05615 [endosymbiont 'TC1' of Trimyema compressum]|uniref:TldD/PmbA family protein n=1 Tax=endosymbiont 'TC1' of Trimyema compressum TaxID=243899 RepID=UPI0007F0865E|nr:TldD/PmbA family protein [endosymbiont 'TC1' of Trimyema compressum]AMP20720.1 hypothetical protein AZF37_05615 [endosymbiont 'TC1' of Trimyema compressum]